MMCHYQDLDVNAFWLASSNQKHSHVVLMGDKAATALIVSEYQP